jgi:hypothetical protein
MQSLARAAAQRVARAASAVPRHHACRRSSSSAAQTEDKGGGGIVELREYVVKPEFMGEYMKVSTAGGDLRKRLVPLRLFAVPETGDTLNLAQHLYAYESLGARQAARNTAMADAEWQAYIATIRPHLLHQKSSIFVEEDLRHLQPAAKGMTTEFIAAGTGGVGIYELRRYRVKLGWANLREFMGQLKEGLPHKLSHASSGTELCSVLRSDVGDISEVGAPSVLCDGEGPGRR